MKDINGVEIEAGMRIVRLIKNRNFSKGIEGIVVENKHKDSGLAINVEFARFYDGSKIPNSGGYMHGIRANYAYLILSSDTF